MAQAPTNKEEKIELIDTTQLEVIQLSPDDTIQIAAEFANLNKFSEQDSENVRNSYKTIALITPYGKFAYKTYKSYICNDLIIEGESDNKEWTLFFGSLCRTADNGNSTYSLLTYLFDRLFLMGMCSFWLDIDEFGVPVLIDIPINSLEKVFDEDSLTWQWNSSAIDLAVIQKQLPEIQYASQIPQFFVFLKDYDIDSMTPISHFSAAVNPLYNDSSFSLLIKYLTTKMSILKTMWVDATQEDKLPDGHLQASNLIDAKKTSKGSSLKKIGEKFGDTTDATEMTEAGDFTTDARKLPLVGGSIATKGLKLSALSTLESASFIKEIGTQIIKPLAAALGIPSQWLGTSDSTTESQMDGEIVRFLEAESEFRGFINEILWVLASFYSNVTKLALPEKIYIADSDASSTYRINNEIAKEKSNQEVIALKLDNMIKLKQIDPAYDLTEIIEDIKL